MTTQTTQTKRRNRTTNVRCRWCSRYYPPEQLDAKHTCAKCIAEDERVKASLAATPANDIYPLQTLVCKQCGSEFPYREIRETANPPKRCHECDSHHGPAPTVIRDRKSTKYEYVTSPNGLLGIIMPLGTRKGQVHVLWENGTHDTYVTATEAQLRERGIL